MRTLIFLIGALLTSQAVWGEVAVPRVFSSGMVLQRDQANSLWGTAAANEAITIQLLRDEKVVDSAHVQADSTGKWRAKLSARPAGGPYRLIIQGNNRIEISDLLFGEVWLCSGQSNMAMSVSRCRDASAEIAAAEDSQLRMFTVGRTPAKSPQADCGGSWQAAAPDTVGSFSGTAYFFGRRLRQELGVPVGLINSSVGGTAVEAWTSREAQQAKVALQELLRDWDRQVSQYDAVAADEEYQQALKRWQTRAAQAKQDKRKLPRRPAKPTHPELDRNRPANLFNGMIAPLQTYGIRGAIWYQGERNARSVESARLYATQLSTLIQDWRQRWGQGEFPFYFVQLPNFRAESPTPIQETGWVLIRESMRQVLNVKHTGMAVTTDVGEADDIHPKDKQSVGFRLAQLALHDVYGRSELLPGGPVPKEFEFNEEGVTIRFEGCGHGLRAKDSLLGFALAGEAGTPVHAEATMTGPDTIRVTAAGLRSPTDVYYNWVENTPGRLYNSSDLPAAPFHVKKQPR